MPASFTPGDIAVLQLANTSDNTTGSILELTPGAANQSPVQTISIASTGSNALRFSDSGTSSYLSDSSDGTQLVLAAYNTTDSTTTDLATTGTSLTGGTDPDDRAVATFDGTGALTIQTHYVEPTSGDQTRSATTRTDSTYFITDKGGLFTNNSTSASLTTNILNARSFGGVIYVSSTKGTSGVSTVSGTTAASLTPLAGLPADGSIQDFYLVQSGQNGATYDTLYTLDQGSKSATINKFYLDVSTNTWTAAGSFALTNSSGAAINATGMIAQENGNGGVNLYVLTTAQAANNSLVEYTDTAAYNANISVNSANAVTLYTATGANTLKGIAFTPTASALSISGLPASVTVTSGSSVALTGGNALFSDTLTSSQLNTSTLTIAITANGDNANDILGIGGQGAGAGQIGVAGNSITYSGAVIGTFTGGSDGDPMVVTFNGSASAAAVSSLINDIYFVTDSSSSAVRTVQFTFTPSTGNGSPVSASETVNVQQDTPTIDAGSPITLGENAAAYGTTLTGINDGESDGNANVASIVASVTGGNSAIFAAGPTVTSYSSSAGTASLDFTLAPNEIGSATITVTVTNSFGNSASSTYTVTVNPITTTTTALGVFAGGTVTITTADLDTTESGVSAADIQYTLTGNPPAADGTLYRNGVALAQGSTFTQADVDNGLVTYVSTGGTSATDSIPLSVSDLTYGGSLSGLSLSISVVAAPANLGNLAVMQLGVAGSDNTTGAVLYLDPGVSQTNPVQSIPITSMSFSDSGTSSFLSDSNDGSLLAFAAYNTPPGTYTATSDLGEDTAAGARGVGTLNASGTFNLATTYTNDAANASTTEQTRSATTLDDSTWYITDKSGLYTNDENNPGGSTGPSLSTNILITRAFGGVVYAASTKGAAGVSTLSSPTATTLTPLPGVPADGDIQDFYMIESGSNGNTYDVLYTLDQNASNATINKFSLVDGSWVESSTTYTLPENATAMTVANNGSGGASIYVVTTSQAANNSVIMLTDSAGWNAPLMINAAPVTVYTTTGGTSLKGIAFAPTDLPNFTVTASAPAAVAVGSQFNYSLTATNAGPGDATGAPIQFTLPAGLTYVSAADTGNDGFTASYNSATGVVTFTGGSLAAGASDTLTVTVSASTPATYTAPEGAVVIDANDAVPQGHEFIDNYNISPVSTLVTDEADLTVNVSGPSTAYANQPFSYTLTAANEGTINANGDVTVQFTLPTSDANLEYVSASGSGFTVSEANGVVTFSGGSIAAGATAMLTVTVEDASTQLVDDGVISPDEALIPAGAAVISTSDNIPESSNNQTSTNTVTTTINSPFQITGVDVAPVVNTAFTGVVATFTDATDANQVPGDFTATITWANGATTSGTIGVSPNQTTTDANGNIVDIDNLFTVTGTYTYAEVGSYPVSVTVSDANNNVATVALNATVGYAPLVVTGGDAVDAVAGGSLTNLTVATFTDPGLVANLAALGITDPTTQFSASINWGDGSSENAATITYNSSTQVFSVVGSHTYAQTGAYSISVSVTPLTVSVERIDSSDPTDLNPADNQSVQENYVNGVLADSNTALDLTDAPSADFIDQYAIGATGQTSSLYTFSLPTVATTSGNYALTDNSSSRSEGELTLSANGEYLVMGGYNSTVDMWAPEPGVSTASQVNRVIGTISGTGVINTTTALSDDYSGGNFRGVVSENGQEFWTAGSSSGATDEYTHYATLGATTSTEITGPSDPANTTSVEIFNGQLYESTRSTPGSTLAGIYEVGTGLSTTAGQSQTLFIATPQSNALNVTDSEGTTAGFGFYMADLSSNPYSINGVNVAYVADEQMGIARYDYGIIGSETSPQWNFSYYIDSTGSFEDSAYTVDSNGNVTPTSSAVTSDPAAYADPTKTGGARNLTGRVVTIDGQQQVQLFFTTGFGTGSRPLTNESLYEVTDAGANSGYTVLATDTGSSQFTGVAFTPTQTVSSSAQVIQATPTVSVTAPNSTYNAEPYSQAAATVTGIGGAAITDGSVTLTYYLPGSTTPLTSAPTTAGTYEVQATFSGDADYASTSSSLETFTIAQATPSVSVTSPNSTYNAEPYSLAAATVTGVGDSAITDGSVTFAYYVPGSTTPLASAPTTAGTYEVQATFSGDADYTSATSAIASFTIAQAMPTVTVSDPSGSYTGAAFTATATVAGVNGVPGGTLEGMGLTVTYYAGAYTSVSQLTGLTGSATAPSTPGAYTVLAYFPGSSDYKSASALANFTISAVGVAVEGDVYILNQTASGALTLSGNAALNVAGTLQVDSSSSSAVELSGNAEVTAGQANIVGGDQTSGNARFNCSPKTGAASVADPLAGLPTPTGGTSYAAVNLSGNGTYTLSPGNYPSISVSGNVVLVLESGTYDIGSGGISISGNASVKNASSQGVFIYNAGALSVSGNTTVNLTAFNSGVYSGVGIYQARTDANAVTVSGNAKLNLNGAALYDANVQSMVTFSGNAEVEASLVVNELTIAGNSDDAAQ